MQHTYMFNLRVYTIVSHGHRHSVSVPMHSLIVARTCSRWVIYLYVLMHSVSCTSRNVLVTTSDVHVLSEAIIYSIN